MSNQNRRRGCRMKRRTLKHLHPKPEPDASLRLSRYRDDYREQMLALHRSALVGIPLGMSQQEDEADLVAIEQVYLRGGETDARPWDDASFIRKPARALAGSAALPADLTPSGRSGRWSPRLQLTIPFSLPPNS